MVLVDTCGWIEWLMEGSLADRFAPHLLSPENLLVPTTVQFELYKWVKRERNEEVALEVIAITDQAKVMALDTSLALLAADIALQHSLSFADAVIYACARQEEAELITSDSHFDGLPSVTCFRKIASR